jgi:hypothetical protein
MSEQLPKYESGEGLSKPASPETAAHAQPEKASAEVTAALTPEKAREAVAETTRSESQPNPLNRLAEAENASQTPSASYINQELKQITRRRELKNIRRQLPAPQRALSRLIHSPAIRVASEAAGKTVSRPSGLLGGGLVALVGTSAYLYLARHIGFEYNYGVWLALLAAGFALGLLIEVLVHLFIGRRRSHE